MLAHNPNPITVVGAAAAPVVSHALNMTPEAQTIAAAMTIVYMALNIFSWFASKSWRRTIKQTETIIQHTEVAAPAPSEVSK